MPDHNDEEYPSRLRECEDAPVVLFFKGNTDLNALRVVNMVGTRHATDYGTRICASFLHDLKVLCPDILVVSGLAYGIDINAHRAALANQLSTVGVSCPRLGSYLSLMCIERQLLICLIMVGC